MRFPAIILIFVFLLASFATAQTKIDSSFTDPNFGLVAVSLGPRSLFSIFSIAVTPNTVKPGDTITVTSGIEANCPSNAEFYVRLVIAGPVSLTKKITNDAGQTLLYPCQSSVAATTKLQAPTTLGEYNIKYEAVTLSDNIIFTTDSTKFSVVTDTTICQTQDRWLPWSTKGKTADGHGTIEERSFIDVDAGCAETITDLEFRTVCDTGYVIQGSEANSAYGLNNICVLPGSTNICGNGIINIGEECDGDTFVTGFSQVCADYNIPGLISYSGGTVACSNTCSISLSGCQSTGGGGGGGGREICSKPNGDSCNPVNKAGTDDSGPSTECQTGWCQDILTSGGLEFFQTKGGICAEVGRLADGTILPGAEPADECKAAGTTTGPVKRFVSNSLQTLKETFGDAYVLVLFFGGIFLLYFLFKRK